MGRGDLDAVAAKDNEVLDSKEMGRGATNAVSVDRFDAILEVTDAVAKLREVEATGGCAASFVSADSQAAAR